MSSDKARRSFDAGRMYRSVVSQQGRVTLEADVNEAEEIRTAESRDDLLDIVGPAGTPDNGFKISLPGSAGFDFAIGRGTLYVGGVRVVERDDHATYLGQQHNEWVDYPAGAPAPYPTSQKPFSELVYLAVTEQEVGAVEDLALREIALGGPDTAGRTRLIQRVHRAPATGIDCEAALAAVLKNASPDLWFDADTMRLTSTAQLKVDFVPQTGTADPCQPTSQSGFLGADNQLIRVQAVDRHTLLWGYDNASFLYRVAIDRGTPATIALTGIPVDVFHQPRAAQWVEVLSAAVALGDDDYVANAVGIPAQIAKYDPTGNIITLKGAPQALVDLLASSPPPAQLFVRMWENQLPFAGDDTTATELVSPGAPAAAGTPATPQKPTGVIVFSRGAAVPGDYWMIGVRPTAPTTILPARLRQFQPPDGPARWATPLATIAWNGDLTTGSVHDCRPPFDNLVELTRQECCELKVLPADDVQKLIADRLQWNAAHAIVSLHVRFAAGTFTLDRPVLIESTTGGELTVSGCGTKLVATQERALVLQGWDSASVVDLSVEATIAKPGKGRKGRPDITPPAPGDEFRHLGGAITFLDCKSSNVERVAAACGSGDRRAASCVTIRNAADKPGDARVRSCEFAPGTRQVGVLLVNVGRATVEDNHIGWRAPASARIPPDALSRALISNVGFVSSGSVADWQVRGQQRLANGQTVHYITHAEIAQPWGRVFESVDTYISPSERADTAKDRRALQRVMAAFLGQIIHRHRDWRGVRLQANELTPFRNWVDQALQIEDTVAAAGQGIVVGGASAQDIRVVNNTIADAMDGIHIGLSTRQPSTRHLFADRVQVIGNTISLRIPWYERRAHAGIFVGNANVITVRDNRVEFQQLTRPTKKGAVVVVGIAQRGAYQNTTTKDRQEIPLTRGADGIRVWGMPGRMLLVTGNFSAHAHVGIRVVHESIPQVRSMSLLTQNMAVDTDEPIEVSNDVTTALDNVFGP